MGAVIAVMAIGSEVGDGDGARDVGEIALDALRRQAAGQIGVHHDRDVTVLEPEGPGAVPRLVARNGEGRHPAGARGDHGGRALGCPAAICRSRSSLRVHNGPPEARGGDLRDGPARGIDGTAAVALAGRARVSGLAGRGCLDEAGLVCEHDRLDAVAEAEFLEDVRDVGLDGRLADVELARRSLRWTGRRR